MGYLGNLFTWQPTGSKASGHARVLSPAPSTLVGHLLVLYIPRSTVAAFVMFCIRAASTEGNQDRQEGGQEALRRCPQKGVSTLPPAGARIAVGDTHYGAGMRRSQVNRHYSGHRHYRHRTTAGNKVAVVFSGVPGEFTGTVEEEQ